MMQKLAQKGFTLVELLLIVIALSLVTGVGYYVYSVNKDDKKPETTSQATQKTETKLTEQPNVEYVEFRDLGFKIKKSEKMSDWSYLDDKEVPKTKYVQSAAHVKKIDECNVGAQYPPLGTSPSEKSFAAFSRIDGIYKDDGTIGNGLVKQFDTFYISIGYPNGGSPCFNENGIGYPVERSPEGAQDALLEALKNAEKL